MKSIVFLLFIISEIYVESYKTYDTSFQEADTILVCPDSNAINKSIVEDFLTKSYWSEERIETGTSHLANSQITLLIDSVDQTACTTFDIQYTEAFEEKSGFDEPANNVTYFKTEGFYFVVISVRQPSIEGAVSFGTNYLVVHDQDLNVIKGYAF